MGLGRAFAGVGSVEVGEDVGGSPVEGSSERGELGQRGWDAVAEGVDESLHEDAATGPGSRHGRR